MPDDGAGLAGGVVSVVSPGAYAVSGEGGDFDGEARQGLFYRDMRHLSGLTLTVNGEVPAVEGFWDRGAEAGFRLGSPGLRVLRRRRVGGGMEETLEVSNVADAGAEVAVSLGFAADFRDIYDVRGYARPLQRGEVTEEASEGSLRFSYRRDGFSRGTVVRLSGEGLNADAGPGRISCGFWLGPGESKTLRVSMRLEEDRDEARLREGGPLFGGVPSLETDWPVLRETWGRSVEDLESLSFDAGGGLLVPAAGAPWFMALFGRDALVTGYEVAHLTAEPARNALRALARWQAESRDDFTDAEPGKILHELRVGEMARFGESPESPYYGTADATPLFLVLLSEVWRWTGDDAFVREMEGAARKALSWMLVEADKVGGYIAYEKRSTRGLRNQAWKDSEGSVLFRDGGRAEGPITPCEVQGYAFDALQRTADLAASVWGDAALAGDLRERAAELKVRFNEDFWMPERGFYALALDGEGRRVDSVTSNPGHLLWSGMVPRERARLVADRLMQRSMFSGWGIRTMAEGEGGYDPDSYHNGSVWPHDNALISVGLARYGFKNEAARVTRAVLDAAACFDYRLPEVFAGHPRREGVPPVTYPTSCSPQAWAAGATPLLVRAVLRIEPDPSPRGTGHDGVRPAIQVPKHLFSEARESATSDQPAQES